MDNFYSFGLPDNVIESLDRLNFSTPTPIQSKTIPIALQGKDILGSAQTGTGKTIAFGIPLIVELMTNPEANGLILTPTRELAVQVMKSLKTLLSKKLATKTCIIIGGEPIVRQLQKLKTNPRLIVGTPGRINDHLKRKSLSLDKTNFFILDETDRMLDMGFTSQIDDIVKHMPEQRQTLLFSATLPANIVKAANKYLKNPIRVAMEEKLTITPKIKHNIIDVAEKGKYEKLLSELTARNGSIIIFVKTKMGAKKLSERLTKIDHKAEAIHGDLRHSKRERVIQGFRNSKFKIMVATDIAARGIDIPHIEHVINYDLPQCPEDYIHRIGRTGRAGNEGEAICFVTPSDSSKWNLIHRLIDPEAAKEKRLQNKPVSFQNRNNKNKNKNNFSRHRTDSKKVQFFQNKSKSRKNLSGKLISKPKPSRRVAA